MLPVLHIEQFRNNELLTDVYCNDLKTHLEQNKKVVYVAHKHDFYLCVLFLQGSGIHEIDFVHYEIHPGVVFFLRPGQTHLWKFESEVEGYIFFHTRDFFEVQIPNIKLSQFPFYFSSSNPPLVELPSNETQKLSGLFQAAFKEFQNDLLFKKEMITQLFHIIYMELTRHYANFKQLQNIQSPTYLLTFQKFEGYLEEHFKREKFIRFYAEKLHITTKHLNRICQATVSKSASEIVNERVLLEAKRLLVHTQEPITQIAFTLGYEDNAYFSKFFKLKTGVSPSKFRRAYQNE